MKKFVNKLKLPLSICLSAALIIGIAAVFSIIYTGRETAIYTVKESTSSTDGASVADIMGDDVWLPGYFRSLSTSAVTTATCRKYDEYRIDTATCTVNIRQYKYAYLTEDEPVAIPDDAIKTVWNDCEIFIFNTTDGTTAIYYKGITRYIINTELSCDDIAKFFY